MQISSSRYCHQTHLVAVLTLVLMCTVFMHRGNAGDGEATYTIAVLPQRPPVTMHAAWRPLLDRLEKDVGVNLRLKLYESMTEFETSVGKGQADFIFTTPPQVVAARKNQGYIPLVRGSRKIAGLLFVRKDSPIQSVSELQGKEIAFIGSWNVCSILVQQVLYKEQAVLKFKQLYTGSMSNVIKHVLIGKAEAGSVLDTEFENMAPEIRDQLRPLLETKKIFPHPLSVHPRVPKPIQEKLAAAVVQLWEDKEGKVLLQAVKITEPARADYQHDYKNLEDIHPNLILNKVQ